MPSFSIEMAVRKRRCNLCGCTIQPNTYCLCLRSYRCQHSYCLKCLSKEWESKVTSSKQLRPEKPGKKVRMIRFKRKKLDKSRDLC